MNWDTAKRTVDSPDCRSIDFKNAMSLDIQGRGVFDLDADINVDPNYLMWAETTSFDPSLMYRF